MTLTRRAMPRVSNIPASGRTTLRVGGSSISAPIAVLTMPGMNIRTVPRATSMLSATAPCGAVRLRCSLSIWRLICEPASATPITELASRISSVQPMPTDQVRAPSTASSTTA
jgi:hypothetical protein